MSDNKPKMYKIIFVATGPDGEEEILDQWVTEHEPIAKKIGPKLLNNFLQMLKEKGSKC